MANVLHAESALKACRVANPPISFEDLFRLLPLPPEDNQTRETTRQKVMAEALKHFIAKDAAPLPVKRTYELVGSTPKTSSGAPSDNYYAYYLPWPRYTDTGLLSTKGSVDNAFRRIEIQIGYLKAEIDGGNLHSYFQKCVGLCDKPLPPETHWLWLTRCLAPGEFLLMPFVSGSSKRIDGYMDEQRHQGTSVAQTLVEVPSSRMVFPNETYTGDQNKAFWAMTFTSVPELEPPRLSAPAEAIPSRVKEVDLSDAMDEAVVAGQKAKFVVSSNGYSSETQPPPAPDKPSVFAEVAGAVIVAGAVALTTGIIASV